MFAIVVHTYVFVHLVSWQYRSSPWPPTLSIEEKNNTHAYIYNTQAKYSNSFQWFRLSLVHENMDELNKNKSFQQGVV
jgi:hypothetical protein